MMWMDVDAALTEVPVNIIALLDAATGKVIDEGVTYDEAGMDLIWHFETTAGVNTATAVTPTTGGDYDWAHTDGGMYTIEMTATGGASANNDTEGFGYFTGNTTANLPWRGPTIGFRAAALNNALIDGGDVLDVNVTEWLATAVAATVAGRPSVDMQYILGHLLTQTGTQVADAFQKFFDVATPTGTVNSLADAVPGAAGGGFIAGTNAATTITTSLTTGAITLTTPIEANSIQISGDATAADNLELQYDTTGLTGDTFPSTQAQVGAISAGGGGFSLNASGSTVTTGNETNAYTDTFSSGVIYIVEDAAGTTLFDFDFDFSAYTGVATKFLWDGYIQSQGDTVLVQYYNWPTTSYLTLETLNGLAGTTIISKEWDVPVGGTGTGANFGLAKLRFTSSTSTAVGTDRVRGLFSQAVTGITNGSTITLAASADNQNFVGRNWNLVLGSQSMSNAYVEGANVSGTGTGSGTHFHNCHFAAGASIPAGTYTVCGFAGTSGSPITESGIGQYIIYGGYSEVAGSGTPYFNFAGSGGTIGFNNRDWKGGFHFTGDANVTISHEVGEGGGTTIITGGGNAEVRGGPRSIALTISASETVQVIANTGPITITDSGSSSPTVNLYGSCSSLTDAGGLATDYTLKTVDPAAILIDTNELQTDWTNGGRLDLILDDILLDTSTGVAIADGYLTTAKFGADFLTNALIADDALDTDQFAADFLDSTLIADDAFVAANFATGSLTADAFAADALVAATFATGAFTADVFGADCLVAASFASDVWTTSADALLVRSMSNVEDTATVDTLCGAVLASLHWDTAVANSLRVYKTDGTTLFATITIASDPDAEGVTQVDA